MSAWHARLARQIAVLVPAPLAAPESRALWRQRCAVLVALLLLAGVSLAWQGLASTLGIFASALFTGLLTYLGVLVPLWLYAKWRADEAWLAEQLGRSEEIGHADGPQLPEHDDA
jgi:hypothetical protein